MTGRIHSRTRKARTKYSGKESLDWTDRTKQPRQYSQEQDSRDRTAGTGQPGNDSQEMTAKTVQPGQDNYVGRTARTELNSQDIQLLLILTTYSSLAGATIFSH
jgi:hypothetical protein